MDAGRNFCTSQLRGEGERRRHLTLVSFSTNTRLHLLTVGERETNKLPSSHLCHVSSTCYTENAALSLLARICKSVSPHLLTGGWRKERETNAVTAFERRRRRAGSPQPLSPPNPPHTLTLVILPAGNYFKLWHGWYVSVGKCSDCDTVDMCQVAITPRQRLSLHSKICVDTDKKNQR